MQRETVPEQKINWVFMRQSIPITEKSAMRRCINGGDYAALTTLFQTPSTTTAFPQSAGTACKIKCAKNDVRVLYWLKKENILRQNGRSSQVGTLLCMIKLPGRGCELLAKGVSSSGTPWGSCALWRHVCGSFVGPSGGYLYATTIKIHVSNASVSFTLRRYTLLCLRGPPWKAIRLYFQLLILQNDFVLWKEVYLTS